MKSKAAFCIYVDTLLHGWVPADRNAEGYPMVYESEEAAQKEIAENTITRLREFLDGKREFDDAVTVQEFVVAVELLPDGSIMDEHGGRFSRRSW